MTLSAALKALALWFVILALAILNGAFRESVLIPALGGFAGLVASGILLCAGIFLVALVAAPWFAPSDSRQYLFIGVFWLLLTLSFEFGFGRFVQHKTWDELFDAYTFAGGNLWPLVLLVTCLSPWLAARLWRSI